MGKRTMLTNPAINQAMPVLFAGLFCLGMAVPCHAANFTNEPGGELTLAEALTLADTHQPALLAARLDVQAAESRVTQSALMPNPGFSLEAENFGGQNELRGGDAAEYTAQLEQTLEMGGKRHKRIRVAKTGRQLSAFDLDANRLDIRAETVRRFVSLQGAQERLALRRESVALAEEFAQTVAARVRAGKVSPMEEDKAHILLVQQKVNLDSAQREILSARVRLSAMWGSTTPRFDRVNGDLQAIPAIPDLTDLTLCMPANPDLARWAAEIEQRKAILAQEKAARLPDVTVAGGVRRFAEIDSDAFVAGLSIPLPVFDRNQGKAREAAVILEKAEQQRLAAEVTAAAALTEAYQTLSAALHRIAALKNDVIPRSKSVFDAVQTGYNEGKFAYLDVLDARRTFFDTRAEYVETLVSGHQALASVERIIGGALPDPETN